MHGLNKHCFCHTTLSHFDLHLRLNFSFAFVHLHSWFVIYHHHWRVADWAVTITRHRDRSRAASNASDADIPQSWHTWCTHVLEGLPRGCFQPVSYKTAGTQDCICWDTGRHPCYVSEEYEPPAANRGAKVFQGGPLRNYSVPNEVGPMNSK